MASDGSVDTVERLNALYKKSMLEKREMFVSSLQNAPEVAERLFELEVLTMHEKIAIVSKPIRQHQKEALFYMLVMKKFEEIDRIIKALELTQNESLRATLKLFKIRLWNQCHFDKNMIKPVTLQEDDSGLDLVGDSVVNVGDDTDTKGSSGSSSSESEKDDAGSDTVVSDTRARSVPVPFDGGFKKRSKIDSDIPMFPILKPLIPPTPPARRPSRKKKAKQTDSVASFHQAASDGNIEVLEHLLKSDISPYEVDDSGRTPLHAAVLGKFSKDSLKCMEMMITRYVELLESSESSSIEEKKLEFLNHQDKQGRSVMHLAAENESVEIVRRLYDKHHCDIFIRCKEGLTPLEIMYIKTPEAIIHLLNGALPTTNNHPSDGKFSLELDFRTVIGSAHDKQSQNDENHRYSETGMLAKLVHQNKSASKIILPHVIVKTFLDLKWQKMKFWLFTSMYVQIFLHLWYTCFVVEVFLIQCPYAIHSRKSRDVGLENTTTTEGVTKDEEIPQRNIFSYLFGDWESVEQAFFIFPRTNKHEQVCDLNPSLKCQAIALLIIGILFFFKEFFEVLLVNNIFSRGAGGSSEGKWSRFYEGTKAYLSSVENIFQLIFITLMVLVCTLAFRTKISDFYYSAAALSVVVAWALILMQVGNISGLGTYVQILGKVIKSFGTLMGTYLVLIIAFSIAFSIMFPREKPFETLPKAFSRVIIMMTGELNYDETFYSQEDPQGGPPIPLTGHIIYTCFTILLTIILINLLIGMVVSDVQGLRGKSEVILRSIQVEQLYVMETSLIRLRWIFLPIQKIINRFTGKNSGKKTTYLDIFVINPNDINDAKGMVLKKSIKDIPKKLQKEIRTLAGDVNEYMKEYMNKYLNN